MRPEEVARKRLFGKRASYREFAEYYARAATGRHGYAPENLSQIARRLDFKDLKKMREIRDLAVELGYMSLGPDGPRAPTSSEKFQAFLSTDAFSQHPRIKPWIDSMQNRIGGQPVANMSGRISTMKSMLNHLKITPETLLAAGDHTAVLQNAEALMQGLNAEIRAGRIPGIRRGSDPAQVMHRYTAVLRDYLAHWGYSFPRGRGGIMSQKKLSHGKYAHVKLTDDQIEAGLGILESDHGIDSDIYRIFAFGIQSCARKGALYSAKVDDIEYTKSAKGAKVLLAKVYESKTKHKGGGIWTKYITWPNLMESIECVRDRRDKIKGPAYLIQDRDRADVEANARILKALYQQLKPSGLEYSLAHPYHTLRHYGAHYWLSKCNYNHAAVAKIGGWHTADELAASYGAIPAAVILGALGI